jgi:hypothetical protein
VEGEMKPSFLFFCEREINYTSKLSLGCCILILIYELMSADEMKLFNLQRDAKKMIWAGHALHVGE